MMGPGPGIMEDENFCLRWNDYEKKYAETFRTLREDDHFAGKVIIIMFTSYSYFRVKLQQRVRFYSLERSSPLLDIGHRT